MGEGKGVGETCSKFNCATGPLGRYKIWPQSLNHIAKKMRVKVQRRDLMGSGQENKDNDGAGGLVWIRGRGEMRQLYLFFLVANPRQKRQKICLPRDSAL